MAIKEIIKGNQRFFKVRVSVRGSTVHSIRKHKEGTADTLAEAKKLEKHLFKIAQSYVMEREKNGCTWKELLDAWEIAQRSGSDLFQRLPTTITDNVSNLYQHTKDWMNVPASLVGPSDVRNIYLKMIADGLSYSRIKGIRSSINLVFKWGISFQILKGVRSSPTEGVPIGISKAAKPPLILNQQDLSKLINEARAANHEWYYHWTIAALTGMRSGELMALHWSDVDLHNQSIRVSRSYNARLGCEKTTKTGEWRKIPINKELEALLIELKAKNPNDDHVLPNVSYWRKGEAAKPLRLFCKAIGIPQITFHTLRACFATHLLQKGVPVPTVQAIGGWREIKVMNRYVRMAGVDIAGATCALSYLRPANAMELAVVNMTDFRANESKN